MSNQKPGVHEQFCPSCGTIANENAPHCPDCGHPINVQQTVTEPSNDVEIGYETEREKRERRIESAKQAAPLLKSGVLWAVGIFLVLGGIGAFIPPESYPVSGVIIVLFGFVFLPPVHNFVGKDAGPFTFGSRRIVKEKTLTDSNTPCASCAGSISDGIKRTRVKQYLVFGGAIRSENNGELIYCQDCAYTAGLADTEQSADGSEHIELSADNKVNNE
jgi:hypothetical protein